MEKGARCDRTSESRRISYHEVAGFHSQSPTRREFVFLLQLLRGENEATNPPVHHQAILLHGFWEGTKRTEPRHPKTKMRKCRQVSKTVRRRHLALRWVPTRSPLGCHTNKPGGHRSHYPRSSLCPPVSPLPGARDSQAWPGLPWTGSVSGGDDSSAWRGAQNEKTITLKADRIQMTRIHTRQMFLRLCHSVMLPPFLPPSLLWVRNDSPPQAKKPPVDYSTRLF